MINFIQQTSLPQILGITDEILVKESEADMLESVIQFSLSRLMEDSNGDQREKLENSVNSDDYDIDQLLNDNPSLLDYIAQESYVYKKNALLAQVNDFKNIVSSLNINKTEKEPLISQLDVIGKNINEEVSEADFSQAFENFNKIKEFLK